MRTTKTTPNKYAIRWVCDSCGCALLSWGNEVRKKCIFKKCNGRWMYWEKTNEDIV